MPQGKKFSKHERAWVDVETERKIDYSTFDADAWGLLISWWRACPDKLLDLLESANPKYNLELVQRVNIRAFCRFGEVFITGSRGLTKTFTVLLAAMLMGVLFPGTIKWYFGPSLKQVAEIAGQVYAEIQAQYPGLCAYYNIVTNAKETFEIRTVHGSVISISAIQGGTANGVIGEEIAQEADAGEPFDFQKFGTAIIPAVRGTRMVRREKDTFYPQYQKLYITSAGRETNESYDYRMEIFKDMTAGKSAFVADYPAEVSVLSGIRDIVWYNDMKRKLTPEQWLRNMGSHWTGNTVRPVLRDSVLTEAKNLTVMEERHCGNPEAIYIVAYDVSSVNDEGNAKCATAVLKCEEQGKAPEQWFKRDKFLKSFVYLTDNPPPPDNMMQAIQLKATWYRYCLDHGQTTYIVIDAASYGKAVLENLHKDLSDGLPPLCCVNDELQELRLPGALPVIYPLKATGGLSGSHDSDSEMLMYMEIEFEQRNFRMLTTNVYEGVAAYKHFHHLKDDDSDSDISLPYLKTRTVCGQIANLRKKVTGTTTKEERISKSIQRDMWSAMKYAGRMAKLLEDKRLRENQQGSNPWSKEYELAAISKTVSQNGSGRVLGRVGGNGGFQRG
ncbi:MAG: hypothetical protein RR235_05040 [Oscillospiraceae bacterium]